MGVIATIAGFAAHSSDSVEIGNLRKASPEIGQAIDQNPSLFNNARVLEIAGVPPEWDTALNGTCYEPEATTSVQTETSFAEQLVGGSRFTPELPPTHPEPTPRARNNWTG